MASAVYPRILAARWRSQLAYPASFAMDVLAQFLAQATELVVVLVVFSQVSVFGGFSVTEVLLIYGLANTAFGLADMTAGHIEELPELIRSGEFDVLLLRPLSTLAQVLTYDISLKRLGRVAAGLVVLVWALAALDIDWTPARALLVVVAPLAGTVILGAIWIATNCISFWVIDGREFANSFTYGSSVTTSYPITIYGPWLRRTLCFAVPTAFIAYFPALALLGRPDPLGLPALLQWSSPVVAALAAAVALLIWRLGIRHYQGTGS